MKLDPSRLGLAAGAALAAAFLPTVSGQPRAAASGPAVDPKLLQALEFRLVGPFRGGRVVAVSGVPDEPFTYYMGATGGGVWKTTDGGAEWKNISDGFFTSGSIGALTVAPSEPSVIYVGTGETCLRNNVSAGDGVYRSNDAGRTWANVGLRDSYHIGRIAVHPRNPDIVYVAALGSGFGPSPDRGVYRSTDGGASWSRVLFVSDKAGAIDVAMDPANPRVLYAATWEAARKAWTIVSGGPGSGVYKSTDGGDTWQPLIGGLPKGVKGKIGLAVSPVRPERVYALVEAAEGSGLYRSDDAGVSFQYVNPDRRLTTRAFYYIHLIAHPSDEDGLFVAAHGSWLLRSTDAGRSFTTIDGDTHGDYHALWVNPKDPRLMVVGNDGGAAVSVNGGKTWTRQDNQPTAEMYRVSVDDQFFYRLYGAQQDSTTVSIPSRTSHGGISAADWYPVAGGEQGAVTPSPRDPDVTFSGEYQTILDRYDHKTGRARNVSAYPELGEGRAAHRYKYRFSILSPIRFSPHDSRTLYHAANVVFRSRDEGQSWTAISGDLTRNDKAKQAEAGGPITYDMTGTEVYCTISALEESPRTAGLLWAGSDDGLVHVSRDGGGRWENVTPKDMPEWGTVNAIEPSAHDPGRAFLGVHRYRDNDFSPHVFRTEDYGKTWRRLTDGTNGIPPRHFVRTVREDPEHKGLLYAGTEYGLYVSFDDGTRWQPLQLNLPVVPITELVVKRGDLVVATQGRSFWILDDLSPLQQLTDAATGEAAFLFAPRGAYRVPGGNQKRTNQGRNPPNGAFVYYSLAAPPRDELVLEFLDASDRVVRRFSTKGDDDEAKPAAKAGLNRFVWDLQHAPPSLTRDSHLREWYRVAGVRTAPGAHKVRLTVDGRVLTRPFEVKGDPRLDTTPADYASQLELALTIRERITRLNDAVSRLRRVRDQATAIAEDSVRPLPAELKAAAVRLRERLSAVEGRLVEPRMKLPIDLIHFGTKLDLELGDLLRVVSSPDAKPTDGARQLFQDLDAALSRNLEELASILDQDVRALNALAHGKDIPLVAVPPPN